MISKLLFGLAGLVTHVVADAGDAITAVSWGAQRIDVFGVDTEDDIFHKYYTAFGWGPDDPKHGNLELFTSAQAGSPVTVTSWGSNRLDYFFTDTAGNAMHKYWDGTSWGPSGTGFENLGPGVSGPLAVTSWGENRFDIVALTDDSTYVHKAWTGSSYYPPGQEWEDFGGEFASAPAAVSWGSGRLDIFGVTNEGNISHKYWDGYQWQPEGSKWEDLGGKGFSGTPVASSMATNRLDIWAVADDTGELWHLFWDGFQYRGWENLGGNFINAPQVSHWAPGRIDLIGKDAGKKSKYTYKFWDGYQWNGWYDKGDSFRSEPAVVSVGENNLNFIGVDRDGALKLQVWDGSQWLPGDQGWYVLGDTDLSDNSVFASRLTSAHHATDNKDEKVLGAVDFDREFKVELKFKA